MKNKKLILLSSALSFIVLLFFQVFSTGHGHVVVVKKNDVLVKTNTSLTEKNKTLTKSVSSLKSKNEKLTEEKSALTAQIAEVSQSLDSTKEITNELKKELKDEKTTNSISNGREFEFDPIKLPDSEGN
jgi:uncharacterized protein YlxW (UPF0749 family)